MALTVSRLAVLALFALGLASCGSPAPRPLHPVARLDDAVALAALLPERAERCVVSRPSRLSDRRRPLALYLSWSEPAALESALGVVAFASARTRLRSRGGPRFARRALYRFGPGERPIEERARELAVRWLDEPCDGLACRLPVARWVDPRTVEVALHPWPADGGGLETRRCVLGAREMARGDAFEVAWSTQPVRSSLGLEGRVPELGARWLAARHGIETRTDYVLHSAAAAERFMQVAQRAHEHSGATLMDLGPAERSITRDDRVVVVRERRSWDELELALADEGLRRSAARLRRERSAPVAVERVDVSDVSVVRHQVRLRQSRVRSSAGASRRSEATALSALLERCVEAHPGRASLWTAWFRVELSELGRPERALSIIGRAREAAPSLEEIRARGLEREALSQVDPETHAEALVSAGLADASSAERMSREVRALVSDGVEYEWSEGAITLGAALLQGPRPSRPAQVRIALPALVASLATLLRVRGEPTSGAVQVAVRGAFEGPVRAVGVQRPDILVLPRGRDGVAVIVAPSSALQPLRALGAELSRELQDGPLEVAVRLSSPSGAGAVRQVRIRGSVSDGELHVRAVDDGSAGVRWDRFERYLARPIAELPTRLFPPPELVLGAESEDDAAALRELGGDSCRRAGPVVRCATPGRPEALEEILMRLAAARLSE